MYHILSIPSLNIHEASATVVTAEESDTIYTLYPLTNYLVEIGMGATSQLGSSMTSVDGYTAPAQRSAG